nr:hypothetical protein [Crucivirus sp.]
MAPLPVLSGSSKTPTIYIDSPGRTDTSAENCTTEETAGRCRSHSEGYATTTSQSDREDSPSVKKKKRPKFTYTWLRLRNHCPDCDYLDSEATQPQSYDVRVRLPK